jgi:predicted metal-dependent hydrolase
MLFDASRHFASIRVRAPQPFSQDDFEEILRPRFAIVRATCARAATEKEIARMERATEERILGRTFPLMLHHADLRAKHVQTDAAGNVTGYLDWGAASARHLPYLDVLHLVTHTRTQEIGCTAGDAWRRLLAGELDERERRVLDDHAERVGVDRELRDIVEAAYPALMAGMSELNWDYSRPRWVHDHYQI